MHSALFASLYIHNKAYPFLKTDSTTTNAYWSKEVTASLLMEAPLRADV